MGFSDLFQLCLDALDRLVFDVFDLVEGAADHAEFVGVDVGGGEDLVDACLLSIQTFLYSLQLPLQQQIPQSRLLMHLISKSMELIEKLLPLTLQVVKLLQFNFMLPLLLFIADFYGADLSSDVFEFGLDYSVFVLLFLQLYFLGFGSGEGFSDILVGTVVLCMLFLGNRFFALGGAQFFFQELDDIEISASNLKVIVLNISVLFVMLGNDLLDFCGLLILNLLYLLLTIFLHPDPLRVHLMLILKLNFITDPLMIAPHSSHLFVVVSIQRI